MYVFNDVNMDHDHNHNHAIELILKQLSIYWYVQIIFIHQVICVHRPDAFIFTHTNKIRGQ